MFLYKLCKIIWKLKHEIILSHEPLKTIYQGLGCADI